MYAICPSACLLSFVDFVHGCIVLLCAWLLLFSTICSSSKTKPHTSSTAPWSLPIPVRQPMMKKLCRTPEVAEGRAAACWTPLLTKWMTSYSSLRSCSGTPAMMFEACTRSSCSSAAVSPVEHACSQQEAVLGVSTSCNRDRRLVGLLA